MKTAEKILSILAIILIFLSGGLLGYSITNYCNTREELHNDVFMITLLIDLKTNHPDVFYQVQCQEYYQKWMNEK